MDQVVSDLEADGYNVTSQEEDDGEFAVIGTKEVPDTVDMAPPAKPRRKKRKK
jgi:hypothetical protein